MSAREKLVGTVPISAQVVQTQYAVSIQNDRADLFEKLGIGRLSEEFRTRFPLDGDPLPHDKERNEQSRVPVRGKSAKTGQQKSDTDRRGRNAVARAVPRRRAQSIRIDLFRIDAVKYEHARFHRDRSAEERIRPYVSRSSPARNDFFDGFADQPRRQ